MPITVRCRCGKQTRVRENAAGKRIKCPGCGKPVSVPAPSVEDYGDDEFYDDAEEPYVAAPSRSRPSKKKKGKSKKKSSSGGAMLPLMIAGGALAAVAVIGGLVYMFAGGGEGDAPVAASDGARADDDGGISAPAPASNAGSGHGAGSPSGHGASGGNADSSTASANSGQNSSGHGAEPSSGHGATPATNSNPSPTPTASASARNPGDMWVQLSNFKEQQSSGIGKTLNVNYRVVSGQPQPGQKYVLFVGSSMGIMTRYQEVDLDLNNRNGTVAVPVSSTMNQLKAYVALKTGPRDWEPVSGEIEIGGGATSDRRPPTVQEAAGASAQGKMFAIANGRFEDSRIGGQAIVVDYVMQQQYEPGFQYFLVVKGQGDPIGAMITTSLFRAKVGEKDELGVRPMGKPFPSGNLTAQIIKRRGMLDRNEEVVSNTINIRR